MGKIMKMVITDKVFIENHKRFEEMDKVSKESFKIECGISENPIRILPDYSLREQYLKSIFNSKRKKDASYGK